MGLISPNDDAQDPTPADGPGSWARSIPIRRLRSASGPDWNRLPRALNRNIAHEAWQHQKARYSKEPQRRRNEREIIPPPYDLETLASLLNDSPDYYAVVDQLATDVTGMGWDIADQDDMETGASAVPEWSSEINRGANADQQAVMQRIAARAWITGLARDFMGHRMPLGELVKQALMDYESMGEGYLEVARDEATLRADALYHIPGYLVRKREDGTYVQIDAQVREVAYFRAFNSDPNAESSRHDREEAAHANLEEGTLKNELVEFRRYSSGELYYGLPPIISALTSLYGNLFADNRNVRFFLNRAMPEWVVTIKAARSTFNDPMTKAILDQYETAIQEHMQFMLQGDDYRTLVLKVPTTDIEITWEKIGSDSKDQDFQVYQTRNRDIIVRVYRMLPHRIGIIETASLGSGTGESQDETYKRAQVDPRQLMVEEVFNTLLVQHGFNVVQFKFKEIDVVDESREMNLLNAADASGNISVNEYRAWLSRIVKDQDFEEIDEDDADLPKWIVETRGAQEQAAADAEMAAQFGGFGGGFPGAPGGMPGGPPPPPAAQAPENGGGRLPVGATPGGPSSGFMPRPRRASVDPAYARIRREAMSRARGRLRGRRGREGAMALPGSGSV